jgi:hypothetical protein
MLERENAIHGWQRNVSQLCVDFTTNLQPGGLPNAKIVTEAN